MKLYKMRSNLLAFNMQKKDSLDLIFKYKSSFAYIESNQRKSSLESSRKREEGFAQDLNPWAMGSFEK
jgi:hypothetical protein